MKDTAIQVTNIGKLYQIYDRPQDRLKQMLWRNRRKYYRDFWALHDVSFNISRGEVVGIVGHNGAGKSTLLQIICGTLNATTGDVDVQGRISALLELGSGFNPEFTGRENVIIAGSIMGMSNDEMESRMESILEFADIGDFVDQPVKTYSSGMMVRLAFAVGVCVEPDILVVDEALSVGDEAYRRKCFARMQQMKDNGVTILFVTHSSALVLELCDRALMLDSGELLMGGRPKSVVGKYQELVCASPQRKTVLREEIRSNWNDTRLYQSPLNDDLSREDDKSSEVDISDYDPELVSESMISYSPEGAQISDIKICSLSGKTVNVLTRGEEYIYTFKVKFYDEAKTVKFGMLIKTSTGVTLGGASSSTDKNVIDDVAAGSEVSVQFRFRCSLFSGVYFINAACLGEVAGRFGFLHRILDAMVFRVRPEEPIPQSGIVDFGIQPSVEITR